MKKFIQYKTNLSCKYTKILISIFITYLVLFSANVFAATYRIMGPGPNYEGFTTCDSTVVVEAWDPPSANITAYFWSLNNGQDDIVSYTPSGMDTLPDYDSSAYAGNKVYAVRIKFSDHGGMNETYACHIYQDGELVFGTNNIRYAHRPGDWQTNATQHWKTCKQCGTTTTAAANHSWGSGTVTTNPTCTATGVRTYTCSVCSKTKTESEPALGHNYSTSWTSDNNNHWHKCTRCSSISSKGSHTPSGWKISGTQHWKECTTCGYITTAKANHTPSDWKTNSTQHWKECTTCGYITTAKANHTPSGWKTSSTQHWKECTTCAYITTAKGNHSDISNPKDGLCNTCNYRMYYMATVPSYEDKTYNGTTQSVSAGTGYTLSGQTSGKAVGSYTVTATLTNHSDGKPYKWSPDAATSTKSITWRILKRDITITALDQTTYYPTRITKTTAKVSGNNLCSGHSITSITLTETPSTTTYPTPNENGVGTGTITPSGATITSSTDGNVTSNYNIRYANGTWTLKDNTRPQGYLRANNPTAILIDGRMAYNIRNISLTMKATDDYAGVKEVYLFNENSIPSSVASISTWKNWATSSDLSFAGTDLKVINWTLSNGDGAKTVYLYIRDKAGNVSVTF